MAPSTSLIQRAEADAVRLGHDITWNTIGDNVANGQCTKCGAHLTVATSPSGMQETAGRAVKEPCTAGAAARD